MSAFRQGLPLHLDAQTVIFLPTSNHTHDPIYDAGGPRGYDHGELQLRRGGQ